MKKEQILRWIIYLGAGLLTFLPLIMASGMYFPYITGKAFYFRIIVMLMFGAWVILALYEKEVRPQWSAVAWALAALVGVGLLASITGVNPGDSIWSNFERMMGWIQLLHMGLLFTVLAHTLRSQQWRWLFYLSLAVSVIVGIGGLAEVGSEGRVDGTLGNPIYLAMYALFHLMLAGYFLLNRVKKLLKKARRLWLDWQVYIFAAVGILNLLALYYTKTRGAILGLLAGLFVALVLVAVFEKRHVLARRLAIAGVVAVLVAVGGFIAFQDSSVIQNNSVLSRFASISTEEGTVGARLDVWALGLEGYGQRPVLGWGPDNFNYVFNTYYNPELFDEETWFDRAHNVVVEWLVAAGPVGALAYLAVFVAAIYLIWRKEEGERNNEDGGFSVLEKSLLTGLVVAYLVQNLSVFDHLVSYWVLAMTLAWLHGRHIYHTESGVIATIKSWFNKEENRLSPAGKAWLSTGVGLGVVVLAVAWNYPGYTQATTLIDAMRQQQNNPEQALETYQQAIAYEAMGTQEARERLSGAAEKIAKDHGANSTIAQEYFKVASRELETQIATEPEDLRHQVFYGQLLATYGEHEAAITAFGTANEMGDGRKQIVLFQLAQAQQAIGDTEAALASYEQAYQLDTAFDEPALRYAAAAIRAGEQEMADSLLKDHFGTTTLDHALLIQAYIAIEDYEPVISVFQERVEKNGQDPQSYVSLAVALEKVGRDQEAIDTLEQAAERFPYIEDQISDLIRQIRSGNPVRP